MHPHIADIQDKVLRQFMLNLQTPVLHHGRPAKFRRYVGWRLSIQQRWVFGIRRGRVTGEARIGPLHWSEVIRGLEKGIGGSPTCQCGSKVRIL